MATIDYPMSMLHEVARGLPIYRPPEADPDIPVTDEMHDAGRHEALYGKGSVDDVYRAMAAKAPIDEDRLPWSELRRLQANEVKWLEGHDRLRAERDAALARAEAAESKEPPWQAEVVPLTQFIEAMRQKDKRIIELAADNHRLRERDSSFHRAIKRITTVALLCVGLSLPAHAQQQPYEPTVTLLAKQAQMCEQIASQQLTALTSENAALKKQIADLSKPAEQPKP